MIKPQRRADARRRPLVRRPDPRSTRSRATPSTGPAPSLRRLRAERADLAVLLPELVPLGAAGLARRASRRRVGYARGGRGLLLTDRLDAAPRRDGARFRRRRSSTITWRSPATSAARSTRSGPNCSRRPADEAAADRAWARLGLARDEPVVCLNTGGAFGPAKSWPVEHFATLARRLVDEAGVARPGRLRARRARRRARRSSPGPITPGRQPGRRAARASG